MYDFGSQAYFRRAEVQASAGQFDSALLSYGRALQLQPTDISILNAANKVAATSTNNAKCNAYLLSTCI